jgi:hypothetical protein
MISLVLVVPRSAQDIASLSAFRREQHYGGTVTRTQKEYTRDFTTDDGGLSSECLFFDDAPAPAPKTAPSLFPTDVLERKCAAYTGVWNHDQETWEEFESLQQFAGNPWILQTLTCSIWRKIYISITDGHMKVGIVRCVVLPRWLCLWCSLCVREWVWCVIFCFHVPCFYFNSCHF